MHQDNRILLSSFPILAPNDDWDSLKVGFVYTLSLLNIVLSALPQFRDLVLILVQLLLSSCPPVSFKTTGSKKERARNPTNVVVMVTAYKEEPQFVAQTLDSIVSELAGTKEGESELNISALLLIDGLKDYSEIFDKVD